MSGIKKVVLAYSGGLDTSIIVKWLQENYNCEVVTFTANLGQDEEIEAAVEKARALGVKEIFVEDLRETFVKDYVFPMLRANPVYDGYYLLGSSIARPLIAYKQIEIAKQVGADAVAHGATGKGNDQVRFELGYTTLDPSIKIIAPWREWDFTSRKDMLAYAKKHEIKITLNKENEDPYSSDANILHKSYEGGPIEDLWKRYDESILTMGVSPKKAPDTPTEIEIEFEKGDPIAVNGKKLSPAKLLAELNNIGGKNGIGIIDIIENRYIGIKTRGIYECPGGTILLHAHRALEAITLDAVCAHYKEEIMPRYASLIYNGFWFSPERKMLQTAIDYTQQDVTGTVRLELYKGNILVTGRKAPRSLYNVNIATFEEGSGFDHKLADGFIKLTGLRLKIQAQQMLKN